MSRTIRLSTLLGSTGGAGCVVVVAGDVGALADGVTGWAGALPLGWALGFVLAGAVAGAGLARALTPVRRRQAADGPSWPLVAAVVGIAAIVYSKAGGAPVREVVAWLTALARGDGSV